MPRDITRRSFVNSVLILGGSATAFELLSGPAKAADLTPLDPNDPTAKSLGFVSDASKVNASTNPTFKAGQHCSRCAQYQGKETDKMAGCNIFSGHTVPAGGWCQVWTKRPA